MQRLNTKAFLREQDFVSQGKRSEGRNKTNNETILEETSCFTPRLINKEMRETGGERAELCPLPDFMLQS